MKALIGTARQAYLKFKLSKCVFAQPEVECLGMIASKGVVKPDPSKQQGIRDWPRPAFLEDAEIFWLLRLGCVSICLPNAQI